MIKSETTLRITFVTRLQLILWEAVIQGVDLLRQVRDSFKVHPLPSLKLLKLTRLQVGFLVLFLAVGALSGLMTGATLACLSLIW